MKMNFRTICMVCLTGAMACLMSSCKKDKDENASFMVGLPEMIVEDGQDERAYIDFTNGGVFKWNGNDAIMVYNLNFTDGTQSVKEVYTTDANAEGKTTTRFSGNSVGAKKDGFFYFYPADRAIGTLDAQNRETFSVSDTQTYTLDGNGNPTIDPNSLSMACSVSAITNNFTMQHIFGVLRLKLKGTKAVDHIVIRDNQITLSGTASMKLHEVDTEELTEILDAYSLDNDSHIAQMNEYLQRLGWETNGTGKQITLDCSNANNGQGVQLSSSTQTPFFISVRPGALIKGFFVDVYFKDGSMTTITNYQNPKASYCIKPGVIKGFAPSNPV